MNCPQCGHGRNQHSRNGCTYGDPDGKNQCRCGNTYMDLSPRAEQPPKKKK